MLRESVRPVAKCRLNSNALNVGRGPTFFPFDRVLEFLTHLNRAKFVRRTLRGSSGPSSRRVNCDREARSHKLDSFRKFRSAISGKR